MALPVIPFAVGVAVGSLATYGATDKALHRRVAKLANDSIAGIRAGADKVATTVPELGRGAADKAGAVVHAVQEGAGTLSTEAKSIVDKALKKARRAAAKSGSAGEEAAAT